jgi:predicted dehydrogenase
MDKLKFALIGCGRVSKKHFDAFKLIQNAEVIAVCDLVEEKAKKASEEMKCKYYTDYEEMLKKEDIDIVDICTCFV